MTFQGHERSPPTEQHYQVPQHLASAVCSCSKFLAWQLDVWFYLSAPFHCIIDYRCSRKIYCRKGTHKPTPSTVVCCKTKTEARWNCGAGITGVTLSPSFHAVRPFLSCRPSLNDLAGTITRVPSTEILPFFLAQGCPNKT